MKKIFSIFLLFCMLLSLELSSQDFPFLKEFRKIECKPVPITPLSKSPHAIYRQGQQTKPRIGVKSCSSKTHMYNLNWSGYVVTDNFKKQTIGAVTDVMGFWTVPKIHWSFEDTYSSSWVGLDGFSNNFVEQIGTASDWIGGRQYNYAWFEMYPNPAYEITNFPVRRGDTVGGYVASLGNNLFQLVLFNLNKRVYTVVPTEYTTMAGPECTSAEWIVEAPSMEDILPLAYFEPITFSNCSATVKSSTKGICGPKRQFVRIDMVLGGKHMELLDKTSHLKSETGFIVKRISD